MKYHKRAISLFMVRLPYEKEQADAKRKIEAIFRLMNLISIPY